MMKKLILADRANMYVKAVFDDWTQYSGAAVVVGTLLYTLQLYAEFSGCMDMWWVPPNASACRWQKTSASFLFPQHRGILAALAHHPGCLAAGIPVPAGHRQQTHAAVRQMVQHPVRRRAGAQSAGMGRPAADLAGHRPVAWCRLVVRGVRPVLLFPAMAGQAAEPALLRLLPRLPQWREHRIYRLWQVARTFVLVNLGMLIFGPTAPVRP